MQEKEKVHTTFLLICGLYGFLIAIICSLIFDKLSDQCTDSTVYNGFLALLILGYVLTFACLSFLVITNKYTCYDKLTPESNLTDVSIVPIILLVLVILGISSAVLATLNKNPICIGKQDGATEIQRKNGTVVKASAIVIVSVAVIVLIVVSVIFWWKTREGSPIQQY